MSGEGSGFVEGFNSPQDMWEYMQRREQEANNAVLPIQREIVAGSYFFKLASGSIPIFAKAISVEEYVQLQRDAGAEENECSYYRFKRQEMEDRNYRYGLHFSPVEPNGEWGDSHLVECWPITEEDFAYARDHGWVLSPETALRIRFQMDQAEAARQDGQGD